MRCTRLTLTDYCVVAFGIILFISTFQWFIDGRKNFTGPRADMGLEVLEAMKSAEPNDVESRHPEVAGKEPGLHTVN